MGALQGGLRSHTNVSKVQCTYTRTVLGNNQVLVTHHGIHDHPKPPPTRCTPEALEELEKIVHANPTAGAAKLSVGYINGAPPPVTNLDTTFHNRDYLRHKSRGIRKKGADGIQSDLSALLRLRKEIKTTTGETFFVKDELLSTDHPAIHMQTPYMNRILNESPMGVETDTIEGAVEELELEYGTVDIHVTSKKD